MESKITHRMDIEGEDDQLSDEEIEEEYRREIINSWEDSDFCPFAELQYLESQQLAYTIFHDYEEAEKFRKRINFINLSIAYKMFSLN